MVAASKRVKKSNLLKDLAEGKINYDQALGIINKDPELAKIIGAGDLYNALRGIRPNKSKEKR